MNLCCRVTQRGCFIFDYAHSPLNNVAHTIRWGVLRARRGPSFICGASLMPLSGYFDEYSIIFGISIASVTHFFTQKAVSALQSFGVKPVPFFCSVNNIMHRPRLFITQNKTLSTRVVWCLCQTADLSSQHSPLPCEGSCSN